MHPLLRAAAERQLGLFTARDARRAGYDHPEIRRLLSSGTWVRLRRGVHATAEAVRSATTDGTRHRLECLAVLLELDRPTVALSHETAAHLWELPVPRRSTAGPIRLTDPGLSRQGRGYRITQAPLGPDDVTSEGPLRVTTTARTLLDVVRRWPLDDAVVALDAALLRKRITVQQLTQGAAALQRWPGARRAARAVALADGRAESPLETRGRLRILGAAFPAPELQVEIRTEGRLVGVVDAWFGAAAVAVEFDGKVKYTDPWRGRTPAQVLWEEKRREDELRALGVRVIRVADEDVDRDWPRVEARLRELLAAPAPTGRRFTATPRARGRVRAG
ncbi:type IV toxin-antitoxin system AbiEi family antitoxin domain-containing protein [Blastococcus sp. SYSU DS1021]